MAYDFDTVVDRHGTSSVKWDYQEKYTGMTGLLPLWVADMDFPVPREILEAIQRRVDHGIFGYAREPDSYFQAAAAWLERRQPVARSPGMDGRLHRVCSPASRRRFLPSRSPVTGSSCSPRSTTRSRMRISANGRRVVENPLVVRDRTWQMDLDGLEKVIDQGTRMLVLCSPTTPCPASGSVTRSQASRGSAARAAFWS